MLLYSRLKLPSFYTQSELSSGMIIELYGLHPPFPSFGQDMAEQDAEILIVGRELACAKNPLVGTGDLNDVAWSYTTTLFQKISGMVGPGIGRGYFNTYHAKYPFFRFPVDYVFHTPPFSLVGINDCRPSGLTIFRYCRG